MDESTLATISIGISSISIVVVFEIMRNISVLRDKLIMLQLEKDKHFRKKVSHLIKVINTSKTIFILLFIIGFISSFVSAILLVSYFDFLSKENLEKLTYLLLLICSIAYIIIFSLICIKLIPDQLLKSD